MIGLLLVLVAIVLALETKSLLLGESATPAAQARIVAAISGSAGVERIIHLKTLHLGPEELLVAAKIGVPPTSSAQAIATAIDEAERAIRAAEPTASVIFLEPDIFRSDHEPDERPAAPPAPGH
jgi:divalent metal cation (Fe/Co/Zn/Cd) transporter